VTEPPTEVHEEQEPTLARPPRRRTVSVGSWASLALATGCGFLLGALVITTVGGGDTTTVTQARTITRTAASPAAPGATVITKTRIPPLVGEGLNVAKQRAGRAKFLIEIDSGGGVFGVIDDKNWDVVAQRPAPGELIEQGSTIHVDIERR
jgi:hypothetical protein